MARVNQDPACQLWQPAPAGGGAVFMASQLDHIGGLAVTESRLTTTATWRNSVTNVRDSLGLRNVGPGHLRRVSREICKARPAGGKGSRTSRAVQR